MKPHQNLEAWKQGIELILKIYSATEYFPKHEQFGITSQLRRATVSISANIAEGAGRNSAKEFLYFLFIARGSLSEVDTLLIICKGLKYISYELYMCLNKILENVSRILDGLIKSVKLKVK
ncbi:MAG: four helix bundle protein [Cytophagaceae bacterium]|nr:four helix bundle protein [Cytophagaceae bacterium]